MMIVVVISLSVGDSLLGLGAGPRCLLGLVAWTNMGFCSLEVVLSAEVARCVVLNGDGSGVVSRGGSLILDGPVTSCVVSRGGSFVVSGLIRVGMVSRGGSVVFVVGRGTGAGSVVVTTDAVRGVPAVVIVLRRVSSIHW